MDGKKEEDPDCNFFLIASRLNSWERQGIGNFFDANAAVVFCGVLQRAESSTKRICLWFASPFPPPYLSFHVFSWM
jgi:hypothetical protein